jgi:hypothetical protein
MIADDRPLVEAWEDSYERRENYVFDLMRAAPRDGSFACRALTLEPQLSEVQSSGD